MGFCSLLLRSRLCQNFALLEEGGFDVVPGGCYGPCQVEVVVGVDCDVGPLHSDLLVKEPLQNKPEQHPNEASDQDFHRQARLRIVQDDSQDATAHGHEDETLEVLHEDTPLPLYVWSFEHGEKPEEEADCRNHGHLQQGFRSSPCRHDGQRHFRQKFECQRVEGLGWVGVEEPQMHVRCLPLRGQTPGIRGLPDLHIPQSLRVNVLCITGADGIRQQEQ
mmetsp:Transcript_69783/g.145880  ORF Transcript_69783/g.145880 Transcript_69783/m.145880 type:complete len:220 (-) Transcript_69783:408-1067(-)